MASSEDQVVRLAVARGWLAQHQVEGALRSAAAQGLTLAALLARHRPDAAQELAVLARAAPVATTMAPAPVSATLAAPAPGTHAMARSGAALVPRVDDPGRGHVVAALREALARDPRFAPHLDLVLERKGVLGEGGMGVVHRVLDKRLGRLAALKVMKTEHADPQDVARFFREAELTARLDHPSVPPVYEAGTDAAGRPYLLMRLIEGQPLSERIAGVHQGGRPPLLVEVRELVEVLVKVGEAVARAHARGMVHRDLKPGNVMVGAHGEVLVLDWGLVRVLDGPDDDALLRAGGAAPTSAELTQAGALLGTPGYMSPEQAGGEPVDARTDVFALGAILCAILTGGPPVAGTTVLNVVANTVQGAIARPRDRWRGCPRELDSICAAALAFDRAGRTDSADAFVADLRAYLAGEDVPSHRYGPLERVARAARRRPASLVAVAALAVVAGVAAAAASRVQQAQAEVAQRQAFQDAMARLAEAEEAAGREALERTRTLAREAVALGGDPVRRDAARILDMAGLSAEAAEVLGPTIDLTARPPPLRALFFLHVLQVHADPAAYGARRRTPAMLKILELAPLAPPDDELRAFAEGTQALDRGDLDLAHRRLTDALAVDPRLGWALINRAGASIALGRLPEAERDLEAAIESKGADLLVRVLGLVGRSGLRAETGRAADAVLDAERAVALSPRTRSPRAALSRALTAAGRPDDGERVADALLAEGPDADGLVLRAQARAERGDRAGAAADYDAALVLAPAHPVALGCRSQLRALGKDLAGARRDVEALIAAHPGAAETYLRAAMVEALGGDHDRALRHFDRAVELGPAVPTVRRLRAQHRLARGDLEGARDDLERAIAAAPHDGAALLVRAELRRAEGDLAGHAADLDAALRASPRNGAARRARAELRLQGGDVRGALEDLGVALELSPRDAQVHLLRARLALEAGDLLCAERDAQTAVELGGGADALAAAGQVAHRRGDDRAARALALRALEARRDHPAARALLQAIDVANGPVDPEVEALLRRAFDELVAGDLPGCEQLASEAIARSPRAECYLLRSRARTMQMNWRGGIEDGERAVRADPRLPEAYLARGSARLLGNDATGAAADADAGLRLRADDASLRLLRAQARAALGQTAEALAEIDALLATLGPDDPNRPGLVELRAQIARTRPGEAR